MVDPQAELSQIALLLATDRPAAAGRIDALADELRRLAASLRAPENPTSTGGSADRVRMVLVGPGGALKHDTGRPDVFSDPDRNGGE